MSGDPIAVSVSLALYFAERNKGPFQDYFITFSANPKLQHIQGDSLAKRMLSIKTSEWNMNTNLQAVFDMLLGTAVAHKIAPEDMPQTLYIISDMEFDSPYIEGKTNFQVLDAKYAACGYTRPNLVFWNVNASGKSVPVRQNQQGVTLVSGLSPSIFHLAVEGKTPLELMWDTINRERYACITLGA